VSRLGGGVVLKGHVPQIKLIRAQTSVLLGAIYFFPTQATTFLGVGANAELLRGFGSSSTLY